MCDCHLSVHVRNGLQGSTCHCSLAFGFCTVRFLGRCDCIFIFNLDFCEPLWDLVVL